MERFDPGETLRLIVEHRATLFEGVPAMYAMLLAHPGLAGRRPVVADAVHGGRPDDPDRPRSSAGESRSGAPLIELWGMTEIAGLGTTHPLYAPPVPGSIGVALPGVRGADRRPRGRAARRGRRASPAS